MKNGFCIDLYSFLLLYRITWDNNVFGEVGKKYWKVLLLKSKNLVIMKSSYLILECDKHFPWQVHSQGFLSVHSLCVCVYVCVCVWRKCGLACKAPPFIKLLSRLHRTRHLTDAETDWSSHCRLYCILLLNRIHSFFCLNLMIVVVIYCSRYVLHKFSWNHFFTSFNDWEECCSTWSGGLGFIPCTGSPVPNGWDDDSIMWPAETEVMVSLLCLCVAAGKNVRCQSWTRRLGSLAAD